MSNPSFWDVASICIALASFVVAYLAFRLRAEEATSAQRTAAKGNLSRAVRTCEQVIELVPELIQRFQTVASLEGALDNSRTEMYLKQFDGWAQEAKNIKVELDKIAPEISETRLSKLAIVVSRLDDYARQSEGLKEKVRSELVDAEAARDRALQHRTM